MNDDQIRAAQRVMAFLERRPIARMFWNTLPEGVSKPLTLGNIATRLEHRLYSSADCWASDVRSLFMSVVRNTQNGTLQNSAARQLMSDFERQMWNISPSLSPQILPLQLSEDDLRRFLAKCRPPYAPEPVITDAAPATELFKEHDEDYGTDRLIEYIHFLSSPSLILRVVALIYQRQPEALQIGNSLVIIFSLLSAETTAELKRFVWKLLKEAAIGTIPALISVPGVQLPVITQ